MNGEAINAIAHANAKSAGFVEKDLGRGVDFGVGGWFAFGGIVCE